MSGFSAEWLALREPADHRARSTPAAVHLDTWLGTRDPVHITDLGCGTGSSLRWLAPLLARRQRWRLLDHDAALLDGLPDALARWWAARGGTADAGRGQMALGDGLEARWQHRDLRAGLPPGAAGHVVSAQALADLVSRDWLQALAAACAAAGSAVLLALSYDGRIAFTPADPLDAGVRDAVNRHQLRDKGFGPALGPAATAVAASLLAARGYRVTQWRSDWRLGADSAALQAALVRGWCDAAAETGAVAGAALGQWQARRLAAIGRGALTLRVGHADLLALPATPPA